MKPVTVLVVTAVAAVIHQQNDSETDKLTFNETLFRQTAHVT